MDVSDYFEKSNLLHALQQRISEQTEAQTKTQMAHNEAAVHLKKYFVITELNWERRVCYVQSMSNQSQPYLRNMVKSFLIEQYGQKALQMQVVVNRSSNHITLSGKS